MISNKLKFLSFFFFIQVISVNAQSKITDYLNVPGPIKIENKDYNLIWSSHPNKNYYKQEYLNSNDKIEKYDRLIIIEFVKGNFKLDDVVEQKVNEIEALKKSNPIVNHIVYENNGEYILDFLVSENSKDGKEIKIVERNVYRYKLISTNDIKGVFLFAVSERGYENNLDDFFTNLKNNNTKLIEIVGNYELPSVKIK